MTKLNFCTLFDVNYLLRGLCLIHSLNTQEKDFHLYVLAMDDITYQFLAQHPQQNVTPIRLQDFESPELLAIKSTRTKGEYCWTCTPSIIDYCIHHFDLDHCTYLDADIYFFAPPRSLIEEAGQDSILLTKHNYSPEYDQTKISGTYCVQFMYFKKTPDGTTALKWWKDRCIEWCYARYEDGKFGDQKYLDDWTTRFNGVHELQHHGALAPWNIQQYSFVKNSPLVVTFKPTNQTTDVVFYHFHDLKIYDNGSCDLGFYKISPALIYAIYSPYLACIEKNRAYVQRLNFSAGDYRPAPRASLRLQFHHLKRRIKGNFYVIKIRSLVENQNA